MMKKILMLICYLFSCVMIPVTAAELELGNTRITLIKNTVYSLKTEDIANALVNETRFEKIKITKLPPATEGTLTKNSQPITAGEEIVFAEISAVTFTPEPDSLREASFSYLVYSGTRISNEAVFTIDYIEPEESKKLQDLYVGTEKNISREIKLLPDGYNGHIQFVIPAPPKNGSLNAKDEYYHTVVYTPNKNFIGEDTFTYQELGNNSNLATVTVTVSDTSEPLPVFVHEDLKNHWANYSAGNMADRNLIKGEYAGGKYYFYPDKKMTRWEFLNYLLASAGMNIDTAELGYVSRYEDSEILPDYINKIAALATQLGILNGVSEGEHLYIHPYQELTRAEAATMLGKLLASDIESEDKLYFTDRDDIPVWARKHIINLVNFGILQGFDDNTIRPYAPLNKAQTVEMLYQGVKYSEKEPEVLRSLKRVHQYYY